eukprot:GFYU01004209.1.p1 GENE.GFYU01004209.1~~GFYU01004209.1.p1  ORF type:complete len:375 (+),score=109.27 GFYU01004209.1:164-1288(+)
MSNDDRYAFITEWKDEQAGLIRKYMLLFYIKDQSVEMIDLKSRKLFLKRCPLPSVNAADLYLGAKVSVMSRLLNLVDYADDYTRQQLGRKTEHTLAMIKPDAYVHAGKIIKAIHDNGFVIKRMKMFRFTPDDVDVFYGEHIGKPFFDGLKAFVTSDCAIALELVADDCIQKWRNLIGPTNTEKARAEAPRSLRALYGTDGTRNACHGSDSEQSADREVRFFFDSPGRFPTTALFSNCAVAVLKPHVIREGLVGNILQAILDDGFEISAMQQFMLDRQTCEEFLEVYKGVVPEYNGIVEEMLTGPVIACEVRAENAVPAFREFCGPHDPEIAKHLRPNTVRAKFGHDKLRNAIHCTDLPEDGPLESEYFFSILYQ